MVSPPPSVLRFSEGSLFSRRHCASSRSRCASVSQRKSFWTSDGLLPPSHLCVPDRPPTLALQAEPAQHMVDVAHACNRPECKNVSKHPCMNTASSPAHIGKLFAVPIVAMQQWWTHLSCTSHFLGCPCRIHRGRLATGQTGGVALRLRAAKLLLRTLFCGGRECIRQRTRSSGPCCDSHSNR